ncbi:hypothetical protein LVB87_11555 [Lysobacter sp. KIS68-7]|uniref:hypothetical protein n=1 Tax=Lysobacter sp. KIS68-7 TaxID=2904252 RepID=UPI001E46A97F|nr:hypothetical protein [Lysobacter sp. KIS68-7]UHQ18817.1 hypothetical protein LVB87_11555 [Lysobacter sp. KIS68-7]
MALSREQVNALARLSYKRYWAGLMARGEQPYLRQFPPMHCGNARCCGELPVGVTVDELNEERYRSWGAMLAARAASVVNELLRVEADPRFQRP